MFVYATTLIFYKEIPQICSCLVITIWRFKYCFSSLMGQILKELLPFFTERISCKSLYNQHLLHFKCIIPESFPIFTYCYRGFIMNLIGIARFLLIKCKIIGGGGVGHLLASKISFNFIIENGIVKFQIAMYFYTELNNFSIVFRILSVERFAKIWSLSSKYDQYWFNQ